MKNEFLDFFCSNKAIDGPTRMTNNVHACAIMETNELWLVWRESSSKYPGEIEHRGHQLHSLYAYVHIFAYGYLRMADINIGLITGAIIRLVCGTCKHSNKVIVGNIIRNPIHR